MSLHQVPESHAGQPVMGDPAGEEHYVPRRRRETPPDWESTSPGVLAESTGGGRSPWLSTEARSEAVNSSEAENGRTPARSATTLPALLDDDHRTIATQRGWDFVALDDVALDEAVTGLLPSDIARLHSLVPFSLTHLSGQAVLRVATKDPNDFALRTVVNSHLYGYTVKFAYAAPAAIERAVDRAYSAGREAGHLAGGRRTVEEPAQTGTEGGDLGRAEPGEETETERILRLMIEEALRHGAADIQIEPTAFGLDVRYAIDGRLVQPSAPYPAALAAPLVNMIRAQAAMALDNQNRPDSGALRWNLRDGRTVDLRVEVIRTIHGLAATLRVQSRSRRTLDEIGLTEANKERFTAAISSPGGMIVVTGPTASGKNVTLHAGLLHRISPETKIIAIEDPVEQEIDRGVTQIAVDEATGRTFPAALRSVLRMAPKIIMVGEIRDNETATLAVDASHTGHLVLTTLHTDTAVGAIDRLARLGIDPRAVADTIVAIVGQRLVRTLCEACKVLLPVDPRAVAALGFDASSLPDALYQPNPQGCPECLNLGWRGRIGIHEIILNSAALSEAIATGATTATLNQIANRTGTTTLREDGLVKVLTGVTTLEEINSVTRRWLVTDPRDASADAGATGLTRSAA